VQLGQGEEEHTEVQMVFSLKDPATRDAVSSATGQGA